MLNCYTLFTFYFYFTLPCVEVTAGTSHYPVVNSLLTVRVAVAFNLRSIVDT